MTWLEAKDKIAHINDHYSMSEAQHEILYGYAIKVPKGGCILELGVAHGKTAAMFILVAQEKGLSYFGVDDFSLEGSFEEAQHTLTSLKSTADWTIVNSRTQDLRWQQPIDLLFIDAGHDEENIKADCEKYIPFVKPGGVVIFDDWATEGPHWAVGHYGTIATKGWKEIDDREYIKAFRRPK